MQIDEKFSNKGGRATCGTTSTTVLVYDNTLYVAHCGDSRAVLVKSDGVVGLTRDHKPSDPAEAARIEVCAPELPPHRRVHPLHWPPMLAIPRGTVFAHAHLYAVVFPAVCTSISLCRVGTGVYRTPGALVRGCPSCISSGTNVHVCVQ